MKLKTKLLLGFSSTLIIFIGICLTLLFTIQQQNQNMNLILEENYNKVELAQNLKEQVLINARLIRDLLLHDTNLLDADSITAINELIKERRITLENLKAQANNEDENSILFEIEYLNNEYTKIIGAVISSLVDGNHAAAVNSLYIDTTNTRIQFLDQVDKLVEYEETQMQLAVEASNTTYKNTLTMVFAIIALSILVVMGIATSLINSITKSINNVRMVITKSIHRRGEKLPRIEQITKDEIGDIANAYNKMANSLDEYLEKEIKLQESLRDENWVKEKQSEIFMKLQGTKHIETFGSAFVLNTVYAVGARYGVLYIKENDQLQKVTSYAGNKEDVGKSSFKLGDGLVGQCAIDNQIIYLDTLPTDYVTTHSGLGKASPTSLVLVPFEFENEVVAVLEIAKFTPFTSTELQLLNQLCHTTGVNINRVLDRMRIEDLLSESQTLTEELQTQAEELQQQQEEMKMINDELHVQIKDSEEKTKQLEMTKQNLQDKNRDIELSSKYKSEFLANMSHELRTPLNSMLILSQMLAENSAGNLTEKQVEYANTVYSSGNDLLNLINDILDLSKIESGKLDIYAEEIEVQEIISFVERQFYPVASQKKIDFQIVLDDTAPTNLFTDDQRLKQILKNLLSNAFKFTNYGRVELHIQQAEKDDKADIVFVVKDTGIGISEEKLKTIFEAFYQADGTTSRKYGGTGLGLSISRELSELLNGYIDVESKEGKGSSFYLYLPDYKTNELGNQNETILEEAAITKEEVTFMIGEGNNEIDIELVNKLDNKTVLIVDDDMRNVFALTSALETYNMNTIFAENGKEAIEILEQNAGIDIVLMDIMMPVMDGYETMKTIREMELTKDIPIIALTAKAMKHDREKCIEAGASDYISKPVNIDQLVSLIKVWLYK